MRKQFERDLSSESSEEEQEVRVVDYEYLRKLGEYKLNSRQCAQRCVPEDSEEEDEDVQALKPCLSPQHETLAKNQSERGLLHGRTVGVGMNRPSTAYSFKPKPPLRRIRPNDPVARYQQMSRTWKSDKFLSGGANKKQGRKLELDKRCRQYGQPQ